MVSLVGAGPGAPDLITVRGLRRVQQAEVIVHDRLVSPELIAMAPKTARRVNVGKAPSRRRFPQEEINRILVAEAQAGRRVVRLKGGDPFVFGLASSECRALAKAGVPFEVVPGLSAAIALPGLVGAALTCKGGPTSFCVLSGHHPPGHPLGADFDRLPTDSTLVVLMGRRHLKAIVTRLVETGWDPATPALLVASGATMAEVTSTGSLVSAPERATTLSSPMTLVVGTGVGLRAELGTHFVRALPQSGVPWGESAPIPSSASSEGLA